jgi:signal transduction histidine kinase
LRIFPLIILVILLPFDLFIKDAIFSGPRAIPINGPLFPVYSLTLSIYVLLTIKNFYFQFKGSHGYQRQKILYVLLGLSIFLSVSTIVDLILPGFGFSQFRFIGPISSLFFTFLAAWSIVSFRLMDVRLVLSAIAVNALSFIISVFVIVSVHAELREDRVRGPIFALLFVIGLLIFLVARYMLNFLFKKLFLKNYYDFQKNIDELNENLRQQQQPINLAKLVNKSLKKALSLTWIYFYDNTEKRFYFEEKDSALREKLRARVNFTADENFQNAAAKLKQPYFFGNSQSSILGADVLRGSAAQLPAFANVNPREMPLAVLPLAAKEKTNVEKSAGYFVLGPQKNFIGISHEQIQKIRDCWSHIQTAYSRALLHQNLENRVSAQVEDIVYKNRRLKEEVNNRMEFVRATSHQLRTPITALSGALQLLLRKFVTKENSESTKKGAVEETALEEKNENAELVHIAYEKAQQLSEIVSDVLSLTKIQKSDARETHSVVDLNKIFANLIPVIEPLMKNKGLQLNYEIAADVKVVGNQSYLEQAFFNILENAIAHTNKGGIKIYFKIEPEFIITSIEDSGVGIDLLIQDKIFRKNLHNPKSGGVGLGLYLVKTIINFHPKGHVWFESGPKGTTFFIRLKQALPLPD